MRYVCMLVCVGVLIGGIARAAEPAGIFTKDPDPTYERAGRVDPFTLGELDDEGGCGIPPDPWTELQLRLKNADPAVRLGALGEMLSTSREDRFDRCLAECARQIELLRTVISFLDQNPEEGAGKLGEYAELLEAFQRLEATARRLKERRDVQAEFAGFKLKVEGIVCRGGRASTAVVAGELVTEGSLLRPAGAGHDVRVRRIAPGSVTCLYRGLEVELGF